MKFESEAELYFAVKYKQSDFSHFLMNDHRIRKKVSLDGLKLLILYLQFNVGDNLQSLYLEKRMTLVCIVVYQ